MTDKLIGLGKLMRLEKPIGTFLLLWPTLSAFIILKDGSPTPWLVIIFCIGTFLMRSAGCVINDFFDRDFDGKVERTKNRPLVTGQVKSFSDVLSLISGTYYPPRSKKVLNMIERVKKNKFIIFDANVTFPALWK